MLITHFNKMIRSKILWGFFAIVISVSFLGFIGVGFSVRGQAESRGNAYGQLYGQDVSPDEFLRARFFELGFRSDQPRTPKAEEALRQRTWRRLAMLRSAERMGITVSDAEMTEAIVRDPAFGVSGAFSKDQYRSVLERQIGVDVPTFEQYLRQELVLRKMARTLESATWAAPAEINEKVIDLSDLFTVEYVTLTTSNYTPSVNVSEEQAREYFTVHPDTFLIPERVSVRYVEFPISNHLQSAEITDDEISDYYDEHLDDYSSTDTNGTYQTTPLAEVRDKITSALRQRNAEFRARELATDFSIVLTPDVSGHAPTMAEAAALTGLVVRTSALFSAREPVPGLEVGEDFRRAAFSLDPEDPERYFSDSVLGERSAYVLATDHREPSRMPEFAEARQKAMDLAREKAVREATEAHFKSVRDAIAKGVQSGQTMAQAARFCASTVVTTQPFAVYSSAAEGLPNGRSLLPAVMSMKKGDVTAPLRVDDGLLIACVTDRQPGEVATMQMLRPELQGTLDRYRAGILFNDIGDHLLAQASFKDLHPRAEDSSDEDPATPEGSPSSPSPLEQNQSEL